MSKLKTTLATKFSITFALLLIIIMAAVAYAVQESVTSEFIGAYEKNMNSLLNATEKEIIDTEKNIRLRLNEFADQVARDEEFKLFAQSLKDTNEPYTIDYASKYIKAMRLDALEITDRRGNILSSGFNYGNTYIRNKALTVFRLRTSKEQILIMWFNNYLERFPAITAIDSLISQETKFYVMAAVKIDSTFLRSINRDSTNLIIAKLDDKVITTSPELNRHFSEREDTTFALPNSLADNYIQGSFKVPSIVRDRKKNSEFILLQPKKELAILIEQLQRNIFVITAIGIIIAIILSVWRTRKIAKPLKQLAIEAGALSLNNLELNFHTEKKDEVGLLSKALHEMVHRLHQSRIELTAAEQKAARAEIARQVNHDLRNGFLPIRHVLEHWEEVAENEPENLLKYFNERKANVKESLDYLQNLSKLYTRIQPQLKPEIININLELKKLVNNYSDFIGERIDFEFTADTSNPSVLADKIQIRRVFENILRNAVEAIKDKGKISISTIVEDNLVIIKCVDTGTGIPKEIIEQLFTSNITTKKEGTGLGLANVKRIIDDLDGKLKIDSREGNGTIIRITLPLFTQLKND